MVAFPDFEASGEYLSKKLGITSTRGRLILERLMFLGVLERKSCGKWAKSQPFIKTKDRSKTSSVLKKLQIDFRKKAIESIENDPIEKRHMTGMTFAINPEKVVEAKKIIDRFAEEISEFLEEGGQSSIYQLNISLFPLLKEETEKKQNKYSKENLQ